MLQGKLISLRARVAADVPVLHAQMHDDLATYLLASGGPWRPIPADSEDGPFAVKQSRADVAAFSVVENSTGELAGSAQLWGIDAHNRNAHLGVALFPAVRGRGLGLDVLTVLCNYGFSILGLHRLALETAAENQAMQKAARRAGFTQEGVHRQSYWIGGHFSDEVTFGLLAEEFALGLLADERPAV